MKTCLSFNDILQISRPQLEEMQKVGNSFADPGAPSACEAFTAQIKAVEGSLRQTYRMAAVLAKKAEDLSEVAEVWSQMSAFCRHTLESLASLKLKYPGCGTPQLYDLALDYKLACDKRYQGVVEELSCQNTEVPKGLFPETI